MLLFTEKQWAYVPPRRALTGRRWAPTWGPTQWGGEETPSHPQPTHTRALPFPVEA